MSLTGGQGMEIAGRATGSESSPAAGVRLAGRLRRRVFGISPDETSFARRGFHGHGEAVAERLEGFGRRFVEGYLTALESGGPEAVAARIEAGVPLEARGFAYEGAGMALSLLDALTPWRRDRFRRFADGPGNPHVYIAHVGAGWILGRLPLNPRRWLARFDPLYRWLALDGYGFHEGFFRHRQSVRRQEIPGRLRGYARRAFDQGIGRSLWFSDGADVTRIPRTVAAFPHDRRGDLWAGVGLACGFAGGRTAEEIQELGRAAAAFAPQLAQGTAFAATARERAGNPAPHTELASAILCGRSAAEAAAVTQAVRPEVDPDESVDAPEPGFEVWRRRIQQALSGRRDA